MGLGGVNITQLLIILAIVILIFGTKRLKNLGGDLGGALKSFRKAMDTDDDSKSKDDGKGDPPRLGADGDKTPDAEFSEQSEEQKQN